MTRDSNLFHQSFFVTAGLIILGGVVVFLAIFGALYLGSRLSSTGTPTVSQPTLTEISPGQATQSAVPALTDTAQAQITLTVSDSETAAAEASATPTFADTAPTITPAPSSTVSSAGTTPTSLPDDWAKLIQSSPVDGEYFAPKEEFKKTWTVKNIGTTTWTTDYDLVYFSGSAMNDKRVYPLQEKVKPGKTVELVLKQTAPIEPGIYKGAWMLRNNRGVLFGIGTEAELPLTIKINVLNVDPTNAYDFVLDYCDAEWWNSLGQSIPCPGEPRRIPGFVLRDSQPILETGPSDKPILWVHSDNKIEGIISGKFPPYTVKNGDHFKATVGCIGGYPKCNVTFKLLYKIGSSSNVGLGTWKELYGGGTTSIDLDLSPLAGQQVQFILRMTCTNNFPDNAQGFWMTPRIIHVKPTSTPLPTPTDTLVPTATDTSVPSETPTDTTPP